ncbi:ABC transporter substrate-binding protein [Bradyrhizobium retamae]|nr:ABC transporter substrate-binding protein [Bradyrhizobium retamae]
MLANIGRSSARGFARRVGALISEPDQANFLETSLREKGWILGQNLPIEYRITRGDTNLSQAYARELLALQPDVLFAVTNTSMAALHAEHSNIPTVFAMVSDPVGMHYVDTFSRPGGNVTGFTPFEPSLGGKWVSLIKEVVPNVQHIGIVYNPEPGNNSSAFRKSIDEVASKVGIASIETPSGDAIARTLIVLFARSRMSRSVGSFSCRTRSLLCGVFRLLRWLQSAGYRRSTRFASSARPAA